MRNQREEETESIDMRMFEMGERGKTTLWMNDRPTWMMRMDDANISFLLCVYPFLIPSLPILQKTQNGR